MPDVASAGKILLTAAWHQTIRNTNAHTWSVTDDEPYCGDMRTDIYNYILLTILVTWLWDMSMQVLVKC